jgi:predicted RNA-binding Zn-ribbon protein involved in translation (DUF1610 family)
MTPERWKQIEEVFQAALEREADQRAAFLDKACAGDAELREEVESLLEADQQANSSYILPFTTETKSVSTTPQSETQNHHVGLYCPKCGASNSEKVKYCRGCGENLKVVAQAMRRNLSVMLVSKFDEYLEQKSELFRRSSIGYFLSGIVFLGIFSKYLIGYEVKDDLLFLVFILTYIFVFSFSCFGIGVWNMLAYKRSLALHSKSAKLLSPPETLHCPRCGEKSSSSIRFYRICGEDLYAIARTMNRDWPTFLTKRLDAFIERTNKEIRKGVIASFIVGAIVLLMGISIPKPNPWRTILIFAACLALIQAAFEMLAYKRNLGIDSIFTDSPAEAESTADKLVSRNATELLPSPSATETTTKRFDETVERQKEKS